MQKNNHEVPQQSQRKNVEVFSNAIDFEVPEKPLRTIWKVWEVILV